MNINIKQAIDIGQAVNVVVNGQCQHADTLTYNQADWFGEDYWVTVCYFCEEEIGDL